VNKADLVEAVAKVTCTKKEAANAVDATIGAIRKSLKKGDRVGLVGFGSFSVKQRKARKGRNPRTGETITIKAKKVVRFSPAKGLV